MKKVLSVLLALCLLVGALPMFASAADSDFVIEDGVLKRYNGPGGDVVIPDGITRISSQAFDYCKTLTSIDMPDSVVSIGDSAFCGCKILASVKLSSKLTTMAGYAFWGCESLTSIKIPEGITIIYNDTFAHCTNLVSIEIPKSVKTIWGFAFGDSDKLQDVFYGGTEDDWEKVDIVGNSKELERAVIHFKEAPSTGFTDVKSSDYYADAVVWAANTGITNGIGNGKFGPSQACKREQIVTFLWNGAGKPEPGSIAGFRDMPKNETFQKSISWAVENGITYGYGGNIFRPSKTCTRAEAMTFIWRAHNCPEPSSMAGFMDMPGIPDFQKAISWASENGITSGIGGNRFGPDQVCTRGQIVTFLYNARNL